jgi:tRNA modification GTPase
MNQLARREVAIVSPHAGTTRDIIEVQLDLDGYPVTVIDTAGVRETDDPVEQEGVRRARARAAEADLVLWMIDAQHEQSPEKGAAPVWTVRNKIDLDAVGAESPKLNQTAAVEQARRLGSDVGISASRGDGIPELISALVAFARDFLGSGQDGLISRVRQRKLLQETAVSLQRSIEVIGEGEELVAEELRVAAHALGRLLGRIDVEDVLDVAFREFCIGK